MTKREHLEASLRREMESAGVDALIAVSPENVQHLAGAYIISQRMIPDRLAFAVYPRTRPPFFVVSTVVEYTARTQSWIDEIVPFTEHAVLPINGLIQAFGTTDWNRDGRGSKQGISRPAIGISCARRCPTSRRSTRNGC